MVLEMKGPLILKESTVNPRLSKDVRTKLASGLKTTVMHST